MLGILSYQQREEPAFDLFQHVTEFHDFPKGQVHFRQRHKFDQNKSPGVFYI